MRVDSPLVASSARRRARSRSALLALLAAAATAALVALLFGLAYSGSERQLAEGTSVAGVDVGGLTRQQAEAELTARFGDQSTVPVTFTAGEASFTFAANQLGVHPDWRAAVAAAARASDGFGPIRGFRRLRTRFFGAEVLPPIAVSNAALEFALDKVADEVDRPAVSAALVRRGLRIETVPERTGLALEREAAANAIVRALGSLERSMTPTPLPVVAAAPDVTARMLASAARRARVAVSAPVTVTGPGRSWRLSRTRIAKLLSMPRDGARRLAIAGPAAAAYFETLDERVGKPPRDAGFAVSGASVRVVPARAGMRLDVPESARALLRAATSSDERVARLSIVTDRPQRSTAEALAMGIDRRMSTYKTFNSGTTDRITNLRLGVGLLDDTL
ncbi:MAG TPA: peptidoglycan binding domain-containing protein, partial [Gaiellaceae bacterium]|nr:peptidoglycan binding domain-containing protein [Gaiellaceae bacterium]